MANLSESIYDLLDANITIPVIREGFVEESADIREGALTYTRLASPAADMITGTSLSQYIYSIRHKDLGVAQDYSIDLVDLLLGWSGDLSPDFKKVNFFMESDLGEIMEDDTQLWVISYVFNIKYVR